MLQRRVALKLLISYILPTPNVIEIRSQVSEIKHADTSSLLRDLLISITQGYVSDIVINKNKSWMFVRNPWNIK
jgi:hypothetical protein